MTTVQVNIKGIQEAQAAFNRAHANMRPESQLGKAWLFGTGELHRWAVIHTPHDTGSLRASHRQVVERNRLEGRVFIDPRAENPTSPTRPAEYGVYLHKQGMIPGLRSGIRAFYEYTVKQHGRQIAERMIEMIKKVLP